MTNEKDEKNLRETLLQQNGISPEALSSEDRRRLHDTIALSKKRVRRLVWVAGISWSALILGYCVLIPIVVAVRQYSPSTAEPTPKIVMLGFPGGFVVLFLALSFIVAMVSTISLIVRSHFLRGRQMEDIRLSLRELEEELRKTKRED